MPPKLTGDSDHEHRPASWLATTQHHLPVSRSGRTPDVPRAWLVYAGGGTHARVRTIKNTSVQVVECPLDLSKSPPEVLGQVDQIARLACDFVPAPTTQEILRA
jgi:hypothetical protein